MQQLSSSGLRPCQPFRPAAAAASTQIRAPISLASIYSGAKRRQAAAGHEAFANSSVAGPAWQRQPSQQSRLACRSSSSGVVQPADDGGGGDNRLLFWVSGVLVLAAAAAVGVWQLGWAPVLKDALAASVLGRSGFLASLSLIFLSELGDKTFFIAALMAMKLGQGVAFAGTMLALSVMSVVSVAIGYACKNVPAMVSTSVPVGEYLGIALLLYFGLRSLKDGLTAEQGGDEAGSELSDAEQEVAAAEKGGKIGGKKGFWAALLQVASIIFVAEWGDRSMLATIALGAAQSPVGVASGAICGHAVATVIAILGGTLASKHISERTVSLVGGVCFLLFAVLTFFHIF